MASLPDLPFLRQVASHAQDKNAIAIHDVRLNADRSYGQLISDAVALRERLQRALSRQDRSDAEAEDHALDEARIAFLCPNGYAYVVVLLAIWLAGGVAVPLCLTHPVNELKYTVDDSQASYLLAHEEYTEKVESLRQLCPDLRSGTIRDDDPELNTCLPQESPIDYSWYPVDQGSRALIIYTSGTTGAPKGVVSSHSNLTAQIEALSVWRFLKADRAHHILPLHHIHGILNNLLCVLSAGGCVEMWPRFIDKDVWKRWLHGPRDLTLFMAVPTIYNRLLNSYELLSKADKALVKQALAQFRVQISGSAALPTSVKDRWREISGGQILLERYGSSELGMVFSNGYAVEDRKDGTVGRTLPGVQVRLKDEDGSIIQRWGLEGDLEVTGPMVFKEYWNKREATQKEFTSDGWFKTGDKAVMRAEDGFWCIVGRSSVDIIKSGGEKLSALDVEREISALNHVSDVSVMGSDDLDLGQRVSAVIVANHPIHIKELRDQLRPKLAPYKLPTMILQVDSIPRNAMGKVQKKELVKIFNDPKHEGKVQKT